MQTPTVIYSTKGTSSELPTDDDMLVCRPDDLVAMNGNRATRNEEIHSLYSKHIYHWSVEDVGRWLEANHFDSYIEVFCRQHQIDGTVLVNLSAEDLRTEPLRLVVLGDIKRLCLAIGHLRKHYFRPFSLTQAYADNLEWGQPFGQCARGNHQTQAKPSAARGGAHRGQPASELNYKGDLAGNRATWKRHRKAHVDSHHESNDSRVQSRQEALSLEEKLQALAKDTLVEGGVVVPPHPSAHNSDCGSTSSLSSSLSMSDDDYSSKCSDDEVEVNEPACVLLANRSLHSAPRGTSQAEAKTRQWKQAHNNHMLASNVTSSSQLNGKRRHHHHRKLDFKPEAWKAVVAMVYFFASTWITAIVMVIVHDRVPAMDTYPPLPDILLDNLPLIPWAFAMCEFCGLVLFIIWALILFFHKHRFILLRRMFSLFGSVFLLRCVTMLITSLSVPGRHLQCEARPYGSWFERIQQAYLIWQGGGMSIQGVRTCGDYMFSGHTVVLTLLNFFITEYTPQGLYLIHTLSWVINLFGIFFILAAHEHYSIDVFIAFYISTRLFLYYHTLANNRALYQRDRHRTRIWFPLFYFFESGVCGIVPNEYEIPFRQMKERLLPYLALKAASVPYLRALFATRLHALFDTSPLHHPPSTDSSVSEGVPLPSKLKLN